LSPPDASLVAEPLKIYAQSLKLSLIDTNPEDELLNKWPPTPIWVVDELTCCGANIIEPVIAIALTVVDVFIVFVIFDDADI